MMTPPSVEEVPARTVVAEAPGKPLGHALSVGPFARRAMLEASPPPEVAMLGRAMVVPRLVPSPKTSPGVSEVADSTPLKAMTNSPGRIGTSAVDPPETFETATSWTIRAPSAAVLRIEKPPMTFAVTDPERVAEGAPPEEIAGQFSMANRCPMAPPAPPDWGESHDAIRVIAFPPHVHVAVGVVAVRLSATTHARRSDPAVWDVAVPLIVVPAVLLWPWWFAAVLRA